MSPGKWLRKKREALKISLRHLGDESGLHFMAIQRMESGAQPIGLDDAAKLAPHIKVSYDEFVAVLAEDALRRERRAS